MAVAKYPCLTFSAAMSCLDAKISLVPSNQLIVPSTLLAPATHIRTDKATTQKATKLHTLRPLTYELFFQNSSKSDTTMRCNVTSQLLRFPLITVEHQVCQVFTVFLTIKTSFHNITITILQISLGGNCCREIRLE